MTDMKGTYTQVIPIQSQRAIGLQQRIYRNKVLEHLVMTSAPSALRCEEVQTISAVHKSIQAGQRAMFSGMDPIPAMWLSLHYDVPEKPRQKTIKNKMQVLKNTLGRLGIDPSLVAKGEDKFNI